MIGSALMMVALLGYGAFRRTELARRQQPVVIAAAVAPSATPLVAPPQPAEPSAEPAPPPESPVPSRLPALTTPVPDAAPAPPALAATAVATSAASARAPAKPTPEQIHAAVVATPIVMFTADWCSVCRRAHAFLRGNGLSCVDRDIERDPEALRELKARTGSTSIPTLEIDGELERPGFSEQVVERAIARSVGRRLGVTNLTIQR